jgi:hypothetical protein
VEELLMITKRLVMPLVACCLLGSVAAADDHLEIKGFHVGMTSLELRSHKADFCYDHLGCDISRKTPFTVGGVKGRFLHATYDSDAIVNSIEFTFDSLRFANLKAALLDKYPGTKCATSDVTNRVGTHFQQIVCRYEEDKEGIYLARYDGNVLRSVLFVMSAVKREDLKMRLEAAQKDL